MPVLRRTSRSLRSRLPARERVPPLSTLSAAAARWRTLTGDSLTEGDALSLLLEGDVEVRGRIVSASNATLYAVVTGGGTTAACVYKPVAGERPLWDFPDGTLAGREVAAYRISVAAGFDVVPPTVLRDGPFGLGSLQLWVEPENEEQAERSDGTAGLVDVAPRGAVPPGWLSVMDAYGVDGEPVSLVHADDVRLVALATFDVLVNNADRKAGHLLAAPGARVVGVDHGLTFHAEPKLRTVLWGFAGRPVPEPDLEHVERLRDWLVTPRADKALAGLITRRETSALSARVARALRRPVLPVPDAFRPAIPWPPF